MARPASGRRPNAIGPPARISPRTASTAVNPARVPSRCRPAPPCARPSWCWVSVSPDSGRLPPL